MPGKNYILKPGQVLFQEGEESNGMFLVRKGDFDIYMQKDGTDVVLAKVGPGAMIGEMALFDKRPRSASVKATTDAEVTHITSDEFGKLMKQIPRWLVGLMGALSGRLRQTNERLQKVESLRGRPFQGCLRVLHALALLWYKDGNRVGKEYIVSRADVVEQLKKMFPEEADMVDDILIVLEHYCLIESRKSAQGISLSTQNRGDLTRFAEYLQHYTMTHTSIRGLPNEAFLILEALKNESSESAYDQFTMTMDDIHTKISENNSDDLSGVDWKKMISYFKGIDPCISIVKTSDGGMGLRVEKKDIGHVVTYQKMIRDLVSKNLA